MRKNSFMKKLTAFILAGMLLLLTGCQEKQKKTQRKQDS